MQRSEDRRSPLQVVLGLCNSRLVDEGADVVRCDIENLIKLSQRFGKTTKVDIGNRVLVEQVNVARVELLGFVEVCLAPVPLTSPSCDIGQELWNPAAIWQELARLLKITHCGVIILQAGVVVRALSQYSLAKIGLKRERGFGCLPCLFTQGDRWLKSLRAVATRIH